MIKDHLYLVKFRNKYNIYWNYLFLSSTMLMEGQMAHFIQKARIPALVVALQERMRTFLGITQSVPFRKRINEI